LCRFYADTPLTAPTADDRGPAIRRWEMFSDRRRTRPASARERLWRAMRDCGQFIPGITRCSVGTNIADSPVELVWETTYESVGAYATTYMTHSYHAALLDRFLLPDCPERITGTNALGAGLVGYTVERDRALGRVAVRRLLLLDFETEADARVVADAVAETDDGWSDTILREHHGHPLVRRRDRPRRSIGVGAISGTSASARSRRRGAPAGREQCGTHRGRPTARAAEVVLRA